MAVAVDASGAPVAVARDERDDQRDFLTLRYGSDGTLAWARNWGTTSATDSPIDVAVDVKGNAIVAGTTPGLGRDIALVKYDPLGNVMFETTFGATVRVDDYPTQVVVGPHGAPHVAGWAGGWLVLKYDAMGHRQWARILRSERGISWSPAKALAVDGSSNVYATGRTHTNTQSRLAAVSYSTNGALRWIRRLVGPSLRWATGTDVGLARGSAYVCGYDSSAAVSMLAKYTSDGRLSWARRWRAPSGWSFRAQTLAVARTPMVYLAGRLRDSTGKSPAAILKYDSTGRLMWSRRSARDSYYPDNYPMPRVGTHSGGVHLLGEDELLKFVP